MILEIKSLYNDGILAEAARLYRTTLEQLKDLGGFESYVYEFVQGGQSYILKITHTIRRTAGYIHGELEWLNYLADHGVSVARAVPSAAGNMVESIGQPDGSAFLVTCFEKAPGSHVTEENWNHTLFETFGRLMGRMHALTKNYVLSNPAFKRQEWYEEDQINVHKYLPADQKRVIQLADELMNRLHALPKDRDCYGLIHTDLNVYNFNVDANGVITAYDFDDIGYNWFVNDIAITLYYARFQKRSTHPETAEFMEYFLTHFMKGYLQENELDLSWFKHIPDFLLLRFILLYVTFYQIRDLSSVSEEELARQKKFQQFLEDQKPVIDFDFVGFAEQFALKMA